MTTLRRILIAEDEPHILRVLAMWLRRHGYAIAEAVDGAAALEILDRDPVDLLISDLNMPRMDGLTLVRIIREDRGLTLPIFLLTARCDQERISRQTAQLHRVKLFPKPFVPSRVVMDIEAILGPSTDLGAGTDAPGSPRSTTAHRHSGATNAGISV